MLQSAQNGPYGGTFSCLLLLGCSERHISTSPCIPEHRVPVLERPLKAWGHRSFLSANQVPFALKLTDNTLLSYQLPSLILVRKQFLHDFMTITERGTSSFPQSYQLLTEKKQRDSRKVSLEMETLMTSVDLGEAGPRVTIIQDGPAVCSYCHQTSTGPKFY